VVGAIRLFAQNKAALFGGSIFVALILVAFAAPLLASNPPRQVNLSEALQPPSWAHPLGTDDLGRDGLSEVVWGSRTSLIIVVSSVATASFLGVLVGATAGYVGGWIGSILSRVIEMFLVIPRDVLAIFLVAILGSGIRNIVLALVLAFWPVTARVVRGEYMSMRNRTFVEAARAIGVHPWTIMFREILPNALPVILVNGLFLLSTAFLAEAGLSFLGLNDPNVSSWGRMIFDSMHELLHAWWTAFFPGLAIVAAVLGLNLAGDGLTELTNPRLRSWRSAR
jgi:peptide/nickel transport system permease protein